MRGVDSRETELDLSGLGTYLVEQFLGRLPAARRQHGKRQRRFQHLGDGAESVLPCQFRFELLQYAGSYKSVVVKKQRVPVRVGLRHRTEAGLGGGAGYVRDDDWLLDKVIFLRD